MKMIHTLFVATATLIISPMGALPAAAQQSDEAPATYITSTAQAYAAMQALPMDQTIQMLNLIRFKDKAEYADESTFTDMDWTGEEAYAEYGRLVGPILDTFGGKAIYSGIPQLNLIGPEHEEWDAVFIVEYPDVQTFLAFVSDPEYKKHAGHRTAAVADSRLLRMTPPAQ